MTGQDHHGGEAAFEAHSVEGRNFAIVTETQDRRTSQTDGMKVDRTGRGESATSIPVTEEASHHEVVEVTWAGIDQLHQCALEEALVRPSRVTTPGLKAPPASTGLRRVEDMLVVVVEVIGTEIEVEVHSRAREIAISCRLAVAQEKTLPLEIGIVGET